MNAKLFFVFLICVNMVYAQNFWQPVLPSVPNVLNLAANSQGHLFAPSPYAGAYRSTDGGTTWLLINAGLPGPYATGLAVNPLNDDLFASSGTRIYRSTNEGAIWVLQDSTTFSQGVWRLVANNQGILFGSGTGPDSVRRSTDNGRTWAIVHNGLPHGVVQDLRMRSNGDIYAAMHNDWIFRSTNNGDNWIPLPPPIGPLFVDPDAIAFGSGGEIYVGDDGDGFFKSTDGGSSWVQLNSALPNTFVWALAVTNEAHIFAGMASGGIYRSTNGGAQWDSINTGLALSSRRIYSLFVASSGYLFAGTVNGLYRSTQPVTGVGEDPANLPTQFALFQNFPNPFNPSTRIGFQIADQGFVSLKVFDVLGREVVVLLADELPAGSYTRQWSATGFASGVYFYRLFVVPSARRDPIPTEGRTRHAGSYTGTKKLLLLR